MSLLQEMEKFGLADCEFNRVLLNPVSTSDAHLMAQALADNRAFNEGLIRSTLERRVTQIDAHLHNAALNARDNEGRLAWHDINQARNILTEILGGL
jgi:hypothetical protein